MKISDFILVGGVLILLLILRLSIIDLCLFVLFMGLLFLLNSMFIKKYQSSAVNKLLDGILDNINTAKEVKNAEKEIKHLFIIKQIVVGIILCVLSMVIKFTDFNMTNSTYISFFGGLFFIVLISYPVWSLERYLRKKYNSLK